jgi:hypothetical protein
VRRLSEHFPYINVNQRFQRSQKVCWALHLMEARACGLLCSLIASSDRHVARLGGALLGDQSLVSLFAYENVALPWNAHSSIYISFPIVGTFLNPSHRFITLLLDKMRTQYWGVGSCAEHTLHVKS